MTDDEVLLFYAEAARREVRHLAGLEAGGPLRPIDKRHYVFCNHITHRVYLNRLGELAAHPHQGQRYAGGLGLYQYTEAMRYGCHN